MSIITNPIIPGMSPDPSIIRVDDNYYIATSTFHWLPAIQLFQSRDLANWQLIDYALKNNEVNLQGTSTPAGIWAPHLSYDEKSKKYWIVYSHMINMSGREFNANSYAISSDSIHGPWSDPIYLTSIGFDTALYHSENGKHYLTTLEWETREGYQSPGHIVIAEVDLNTGKLIGNWHRVTKGFTTRGCVEAPQIYKHNDYYYLLLASGGTGYAHGVEIGRSHHIFGPYEPHPSGEPIITSSPNHLFSLGNPDSGQFNSYNPFSSIQKAGHGSLVKTNNDEWYIAHLMSRPLEGSLLNPLGRESGIQKVRWTEDDWLELDGENNLAQVKVKGPISNPFIQNISFDINEHFNKDRYSKAFMTPYHNQNKEWVTLTERNGYLRIYGKDSLFSKVTPSIMATRATSLNYDFQTAVEFRPNHYSETAGLGLYYDSNNWIYLCLTHSEEKNATVLSVLQAKLGKRIEINFDKVIIENNQAELKLTYINGFVEIYYRLRQNSEWLILTEKIDVRYLSDEGVNGEEGEIGGFTGLFNFIASVDSHQHDSYADFNYYLVTNN